MVKDHCRARHGGDGTFNPGDQPVSDSACLNCFVSYSTLGLLSLSHQGVLQRPPQTLELSVPNQHLAPGIRRPQRNRCQQAPRPLYVAQLLISAVSHQDPDPVLRPVSTIADDLHRPLEHNMVINQHSLNLSLFLQPPRRPVFILTLPV